MAGTRLEASPLEIRQDPLEKAFLAGFGALGTLWEVVVARVAAAE